jgi:hypothetical protein
MTTIENSTGAMPGMFPLHQAAAGRIFTRPVGSGEVAIVGALALPKWSPREMQVMARINDQVYLDLKNPVDSRQLSDTMWDLREGSAGDLLTTLKFRSHFLPDTLDLFLRDSHLLCGDPALKWMVVMGATKSVLPLPGPMGLYEIRPGGLHYTGVPSEVYNGAAINSVLRECHWGDGGAWGMATSMEPDFYKRWVEGNRALNAKQDPRFGRFIELMKAEGADHVPDIYTEEQKVARDALCLRVTKKLIAEEESGALQVQPITPKASSPRRSM